MRALSQPPQCFFFTAVLASDNDCYNQTRDSLVNLYGSPVAELSPVSFDHSSYYESEMGTNLLKGFLGFKPPFDPSLLALRKRQARELEYINGSTRSDGFHRIVNIDPGYVNLFQVVLATSKNFSHRVYLQDGIFAEVTLLYHARGWETLPWTYPDYQIRQVQEFLTQCRKILKTDIDQTRRKRSAQ